MRAFNTKQHRSKYFFFFQFSNWWLGFPGGSASKESICSVGDLGLIPGLGREREWLPSPVFWPGEFHGLYSPWSQWCPLAIHLPLGHSAAFFEVLVSLMELDVRCHRCFNHSRLRFWCVMAQETSQLHALALCKILTWHEKNLEITLKFLWRFHIVIMSSQFSVTGF